jgi:hypothetical protein
MRMLGRRLAVDLGQLLKMACEKIEHDHVNPPKPLNRRIGEAIIAQPFVAPRPYRYQETLTDGTLVTRY